MVKGQAAEMALWRGLGSSCACNLSPEAPKAPSGNTENGHSSRRGKQPKRLTSSLKITRREGLRDCTNRLTASYNANRREGINVSQLEARYLALNLQEAHATPFLSVFIWGLPLFPWPSPRNIMANGLPSKVGIIAC